MAKNITRIVLTGGPAAGKTTLISRILREFKAEDGWKVITIPETATELISGFGIRPFGNCVSMLDFQYFVISDQLHKERLALRGAEMVPEENVLVIYDRALLDDKAYITDDEFAGILRYFGTSEAQVLAGYDAVLHLVTCAKGAEFAYNYGNAARYETVEDAREKDDLTLRAWSRHPRLRIIDNSVNFEDKINRAIAEIYRIAGRPEPDVEKRKYLISMPDVNLITDKYNAAAVDMMQTYLVQTSAQAQRRIRKQNGGTEELYFYTEKRIADDGSRWMTEKPISKKDYTAYLVESDPELHPVSKTKYTFAYEGHRMAVDIYPFSSDKAVLFVYGGDDAAIPPEFEVIRNVTGDPEYKNKQLAKKQTL